MTEPDDIDMLAAEYVLGTLDAAERTAVAARRQREPELAAAIEAWERRMSPLNEAIPSVSPPPGLFSRIMHRLDGAATPAVGAEVIDLRRRLTLWRRAAIAASAAAACLIAVIGVRETQWRDAPKSYVGVFQKDDVSPAFLLTIDLEKRQLTVRPVAARPEPGKSYQLWIASDRLGPAPRSLGVVGEQEFGEVRRVLTSYEPDLLQRATFGVSLEPAGGSPTGVPTGPALHTKLYPARP
jgi:anti-sigma-K factor RskA